jgi:hypothetical protein
MVMMPCVIVWFKGGLFISKVNGKKTYFVDDVKDYGRLCLANINYLCYSKHHIWSMDVQDQFWYLCDGYQFCGQQLPMPQHVKIGLFECLIFMGQLLFKLWNLFSLISISWEGVSLC